MSKWMKKVTSIVLIFAVTFSGLTISPMLKQKVVSAEETTTEEEWIEITNVSELYAIRNDLDANYKLMNDIDLTEATSEGGEVNNNGTGWDPIDDFSGVFDGNGHYIKGMQIYGEVEDGDIGLFGTIGGENIYNYGEYEYCGVVKNLGMVDVDINVERQGTTNCGAIVGRSTRDMSILNCFVSGEIKILATNYDDINVGGLCGKASYGNSYNSWVIENCYNLANISGKNKLQSNIYSYTVNAGGIVGLGQVESTAKVKNCYNRGEVYAESVKGNAIGADLYDGYNDESVVIDSFCLLNSGAETYGTPLTEAQMKNANYYTNWDFDTIWEIDSYSTYPYPQLKSCMQKRIKNISLSTAPTKIEYDQGEALDISGGVVTVEYEDGLSTDIFLTEDMVGAYDMSKVGVQEIPITKGNASTVLRITVNEIPVTSVNMNYTEASVYKGYTLDLAASVSPDNASFKDITWSSADETIATVDQTGRVTGKKRGTTTITATANNGVKAECALTVEVPCVTIQLENYNVTINKGDIYTMVYTMSPLDSTDTISWTSADENIVHIDDENNFIGKDAGTTTVTGTATSGVTTICTVTVMQDLSEYTILGIADKEYTGKAIKQDITVTNGSKTLRQGIDYSVSYSANVQVGKAKITITGISPYKGTLEREFSILPAAENSTTGIGTNSTESKVNGTTNNASATNGTTTAKKKPKKVTGLKVSSGKKKLTIRWNKVQNVKGYLVEVSLNRKFTKIKRIFYVKSNKKVFKGARKKTYYVRVRAYDGNFVFGKYSSIKKKKTK